MIEQLQSDSSSVVCLHSGFLHILQTWLELLKGDECVHRTGSLRCFWDSFQFYRRILSHSSQFHSWTVRWRWKRCSDPSLKRARLLVMSSPNWGSLAVTWIFENTIKDTIIKQYHHCYPVQYNLTTNVTGNAWTGVVCLGATRDGDTLAHTQNTMQGNTIQRKHNEGPLWEYNSTVRQYIM